jgi:cysteine synthase B
MESPPVDVSALRATGLTERVGHTPLVPIAGLDGVPGTVTVLGKAEWLNPGGSVKDRAGLAMFRAAERSGAVRPGRVILDATSGNTGIALAWIGASLGYEVTLCVPGNASAARKRILAALGAIVIATDPMEGTDGAVLEARRLAACDPDRYVYLDQYSNPANPRAHYTGTAEEIWRDTEGRVTHLVAGIGTSGTLVGTGRRLRELEPGLRVIAVQPDSPYHGLEGLKHLPTAIKPAIYDPLVAHETIEVSTEQAVAMANRQASRGLPIGWSAGAALVAAERVARGLAAGVVVAILPDGAERYLGDPMWEEGA